MPGPAAAPPLEGRIPGFDNRWNKMQCDTIDKEDKMRWTALDKQLKIMAESGVIRTPVKLQRAHTSIGPFPGCFRRVQLSPRKSASVCFLEQKLCSSSHEDAANPTIRELLYDGVTAEEEGRHKYLKQRARQSLQDRFGGQPATTQQIVGWNRPMGEYRASRFCHKPVMEKGFFRMNGTATYNNLPDVKADIKTGVKK